MSSREKIDDDLRWRVLRRDNYTCRYCGSKEGPFHLDHVYPFSKGGETSYENLVTSCPYCNAVKHNSVGIWPEPIKEQIIRDKKSLSFQISAFVILNSCISLYGVVLSFGGTELANAQSASVFNVCFALCVIEIIYLAFRYYANNKGSIK